MSYPDTQIMIRHASQVRRIAEEMNHLNNVKLLAATDNIAAAWRGDAADAFLQHCTATRDQVRNTVIELQRVADDLERMARK